jgi:hypothetical protein
MLNSFTKKISWLWKNAEKILIILFLATFTFNIRKVFLTPYSFLNGSFNEYLTMNISWADVLMIGVLIMYTIKTIVCQYKSAPVGFYEVSSEKTEKENESDRCLNSKLFQGTSRETFTLLLFIVWSFLSIWWSSYKPIAIYRALTLLEIYTFFFIVYKNLETNALFRKSSLIALVLNGFIQSLIGIVQFLHSRSVGLHILGESFVSREAMGVAKIVIDGTKHIRSYGLFSHPNILAGFLIIPLALLLINLLMGQQLKLFAAAMRDKDGNWPNAVTRETKSIKLSVFLEFIILLTIAIGFILTFSRSSYLGLFLITIFIALGSWRKIRKEHKKIIIISIIMLILAGSMFLTNYRTTLFSDQSMEERSSYANVSREIISSYSLAGVGVGQFILAEYNKNKNLQGWQYQPVHNVFLLIFSELGIVGVGLFIFYLAMILFRRREDRKSDYRLTKNYYYIIIYSFLIVSLFDHYFWDIKTGTIIFSLGIVFSFLRSEDGVVD